MHTLESACFVEQASSPCTVFTVGTVGSVCFTKQAKIPVYLSYTKGTNWQMPVCSFRVVIGGSACFPKQVSHRVLQMSVGTVGLACFGKQANPRVPGCHVEDPAWLSETEARTDWS